MNIRDKTKKKNQKTKSVKERSVDSNWERRNKIAKYERTKKKIEIGREKYKKIHLQRNLTSIGAHAIHNNELQKILCLLLINNVF